MKCTHIIVQAGGKGTRMEHLTRNKPKALVPVNNLPMIFHLFRKYPDKKFVVIGDYKHEVLEKYLAAFADVDYETVCASGSKGTCGGLSAALDKLPENEPFMLIWCDLILNEDFSVDELPNGNYVGLSLGYECRWKYENGVFSEERSSTCGVTGMFLFENKAVIKDVRIFVNTINKAIDTMRLAGIDAKTDRKDTENFIEYTIRIPKKQMTDADKSA